jgi:menaquinone-dependent protoporphyrinogen IX oxidase
MIYHTKSGNCGKLCEDIAKNLEENYEIKTGEVKKIKTKDITKHPPDALIVGSRITFDTPDRTIRKFVQKLGNKLDSPIEKAATFYTHMSPWKPSVAQMGSILKENNVAKEVLSDVLEYKIEDTGKFTGPPEPGQESKIDEFVEKVHNFMGV